MKQLFCFIVIVTMSQYIPYVVFTDIMVIDNCFSP